MAIKRESGCPLCGAKMTAEQLLDACSVIVDARLGVIEASCPFCQGHLEAMPMPDRVDIGYLASVGAPRFDVVLTLPYAGLAIERTDSGLRISAPGRLWTFTD